MKSFRHTFECMVIKINHIGMIACLITVIAVSLNVIIRKISAGRLSIGGTNEISAYCLVIICMLAIPALYIKHGHIKVDLITTAIPEYPGYVMRIIRDMLELFVCGLFLSGSLAKVRMFYDIGTKMDIIGIPKWIIALFCFIGFTELIILSAADTIDTIIGFYKSIKNRNGKDDYAKKI